ncbi:TonB-dependent receptor [Thalassotalea mangrovi]|uniref:TonB-dependent receptor n=1 Tax=Thalassotalea mangrovi TaxID=2572245 RepID=A0A4V5NUH0_9GAMM|nr:TonB-dependent receptor [Thalassotalea mangrovi]TKB46369.1 TonB-dependent receptor [Thalassotalea mangrovi]
MLPFNIRKSALLVATALLTSQAYAEEQAPDSSLKDEAKDMEVIEVTSLGRESLASKVPLNVTAMGAEELRAKGITDIKDLFADSVEISAPGNGARFNQSVTVRGLNVSAVRATNLTYFERTTLAYYLDATSLPQMGYRIKDVERVETLLGPQGTLYGGGSLGGTVRYITNKPDVEGFTFDFNTSVYQVKEGSLSHDTDMTFNVPLGDTVAVRANISRLDDNGYVDRYKQAVWWTEDEYRKGSPEGEFFEDDDWEETTSGRIQLMWTPSDTFDINFSYIKQDQTAHGTTAASRWDVGEACEAFYPGSECPYVDREGAPLQYDRYTLQRAHEEFTDREFEMSSVEFNWDVGFANITSSTAYYDQTSDGQGDYLNYGILYYNVFAFIPGLGFNDTNESAYVLYDNSYSGLEHETRFTSDGTGDWSWIAGFYYSDRESSLKFWEIYPTLDQAMIDAWAFDPVAAYPGRQYMDSGYFEDINSNYEEIALYGELDYKVTEDLTLTVGARVFNWEDTNNRNISDYTGWLGVDEKTTTNKGTGESIFKFNAAYDITDNQLAYFTASQGFRRGGTNSYRDDGDLMVSDQAQVFQPDETTNYELGYKGTMLDGDLYFQAGMYFIEWDGTQTYNSQSLFGFPLNGTNNGPDAESKGIELHARYNITDSWTVKWAAANASAEFVETKSLCIFEGDENTPGNQCRTWYEGGELGGTPEWRHNLSVNYYQELGEGALDASFRARYVGELYSDRVDTAPDENGNLEEFPPFKFESYVLYNASIGYAMDNWKVTAWVDNITNEDAQTSYHFDGGPFGYNTIYVTPRTIGVNFSYNYF